MELEGNKRAQAIELEMCRRSEVHFFNNWVWTYDPKAAAEGLPTHLPMDLFPRQEELLQWIAERVLKREDGLVEKSRDIGFTWVTGGFALHRWVFHPGFKSTFGSRKAEYVDRIGDLDSIFEKIRMIRRNLPRWMLPDGFDTRQHDNHMLLYNPANDNTIRGEAGDDMGRGGRSSAYFIDEAAFIEHAERVEAATSANTDVRIWGSSANGTGNHFYRKRFSGQLPAEQIFRYHYSDDPRKTPEWAAKKKATMEEHLWASEYDIDYASSVEGICIPNRWVESAKRLKKALLAAGRKVEAAVNGVAGGDVGAGKAKSVTVARFGPLVMLPQVRSEPDTHETALWMLKICADASVMRSDKREARINVLRFDSVGVGKGVESTLSRHGIRGLTTVATNVGIPPTDARWPDGESSVEKFANLKAEGWWTVRERCKNAHELLLHLRGEEGGKDHPVEDCILLPDDTEGPAATQMASELSVVKWVRNEKGKIAIESKQSLAKRGVASPDHAEALVLTYCGHSKVETWLKAFGAAA